MRPCLITGADAVERTGAGCVWAAFLFLAQLERVLRVSLTLGSL